MAAFRIVPPTAEHAAAVDRMVAHLLVVDPRRRGVSAGVAGAARSGSFQTDIQAVEYTAGTGDPYIVRRNSGNSFPRWVVSNIHDRRPFELAETLRLRAAVRQSAAA
jgi:hypothetical protein